jgi:hypothetical protein
MPRKNFEGFSILDAEDVNTYLMDQAVMSFANTAARSSAIPSPTDGMVSWLQNTDQLEIYNGSSWSDPFTKPSYVFISRTIFSGVLALSIGDIFSNKYNDYKVIIEYDNTASNFTFNSFQMLYSPIVENSAYKSGEYEVGVRSAVTAASTTASGGFISLGQASNVAGYGMEIDIYSPYLTTTTRFTSQSVGASLQFSGGAVETSRSYDGIRLTGLGNSSGIVLVYGKKES